MKRILVLIIVVFLTITTFGQTNENPTRNLDFEILDGNKAKDWSNFGDGDYTITYDTSIVQSGKISALIEGGENGGEFKAVAYNIPANFGGKKIKLTGYLKTENVRDGYAGLWMRIDPSVAFDNMLNRGVTGTTDWKKYEITLDLKPQAKTIVIGGLIVGKGKVWIDNLKVTIDGKSLENTPEKKIFPSEKDKEFDNGSNISFPKLTNELTINLELLGKVWGFLKYYHPEIGKGNYNWDYELFRFLPEFLNVKNNKERDKLLITWIEKYGELKPCKSCKKTKENAFLKPDLKWITNSNLTTNLKDKLNFIQKNRHQGEHYYVGMTHNVGNPEFKNENSYSDMPYPDEGFRLLSLYKYWNIIHYFFPNKHLIDKDWNTVLKEYIPKFINAKNELEYELTTVQIIGDIKDTHANLWGGNDKIKELKGDYYAPIHVRFIENKLVVTDYYNPEMKKEIGLEIGDVITKINGKLIKDLVKEKHNYYPASNQPTRLRGISGDILQSNSESISINYINDKKEFQKDLKLFKKDKLNIYRWYRNDPDGKSYKMLNNNIGYVTLKNIKSSDIEDIKTKFKDTKGIIIDIRNYPSTFVPFSLGSYFTSKSSAFVKFTNGNVNNPGEFNYGKDLSIPSKGKTYKGKLIILVNELTQSQAEYTAMAFKAGDNTTIVGSTTAGADGNVSSILLPGGLRTMISGIGVHYPDGTETQRIGIVADVEVLPTIEGVKNGKDEPLEKAIELIEQ